MEDILCQTRLRLELFQDSLHNPSLNNGDRLLEQLRKERSYVADLLNQRDGIRFGVRIRVDGPAKEVQSTAQSFTTASTCMKSCSTELPPKRLHEKGKNPTEWVKYSAEHGLVPDPGDEPDWSGRGQHVEYEPSEESKIPLITEKETGSDVNSKVESTLCRKIRLAIKTIFCHSFPRHVNAVREVEHLQRLRHAHLIHTYTLRRDLSTLLHPVAEYNLAEFSPSLCFKNTKVSQYIHTSNSETRARLLRRLSLLAFFGCLSKALHFVHSNATKHMDIKPQNILVKKRTDLDLIHPLYKVYIADFGIAGSYDTTSDAETSTPVGFTRTYAAPEVLSGEKRGFSADVFSLGCVFAEMLSTIEIWDARTPDQLKDFIHELKSQPTGPSGYAVNTKRVQHRLKSLRKFQIDDETAGIIHLTIQMLCPNPSRRPSSKEIADSILVDGSQLHPDRYCCDIGPDPFELVDDDSASIAVEAQYKRDVNRAIHVEACNTPFTVQIDNNSMSPRRPVPKRPVTRLPPLFTEF